MNRPAGEFLEGRIADHSERIEVLLADQNLKRTHLQRAEDTFVTVNREYEEHLARLDQLQTLRSEEVDGADHAALENSSESDGGEAEEPAAAN